MAEYKVEYTNSEIEKKYPQELLKYREVTEGNIVACMWKNPSLYKDYKDELTVKDFITKHGQSYYSLGKTMFEVGYKNFDALSVASYLNDKPEVAKMCNYNSMAKLMELVNIENTEAYYDELVKANILLRLHEKGFNVANNMLMFQKYTSEMVYNHFDFFLNDTFVKKQLSVKPVDLTDDYDDFFTKCDSGENVGISFGSACPLLSYHFAGLHKGNMLLHTAHSGVGKTSSAIVFYLLPLLEAGEKVVVIANEQGEKDWRSMIIPTIINTKISGSFPRQRMQYGNFSESEWGMLEGAKHWLKQYAGNLVFVQLYDYSISTIKKIIHKYNAQGYENFIYDTAKPEDETSDKSWAVFTENSKELFQIANQEDIVLICTAQLSMATLNQRFVNGMCLAKSKAIKEVAGQMVMIRNLWKDEYTGENKDVRAFNYVKNESGKYTTTKEYVTLDTNKQYAVVFLEKNRYGKDGVQLLYQRNLDFNSWTEVGYCEVHPI